MIVIDVETSGLDPQKNSLLSLGAVDYDTGKNFYGECLVSFNREIDTKSLEINGFKLEDIQAEGTKPMPYSLYFQFYNWVKDNNFEPLLAGKQPWFDAGFIKDIHRRFWGDFDWIFGYRMVDLCSVYYAKYKRVDSLDDILKTLGLEPEPKPHNALTGALLEKMAFEILLKDKNG